MKIPPSEDIHIRNPWEAISMARRTANGQKYTEREGTIRTDMTSRSPRSSFLGRVLFREDSFAVSPLPRARALRRAGLPRAAASPRARARLRARLFGRRLRHSQLQCPFDPLPEAVIGRQRQVAHLRIRQRAPRVTPRDQGLTLVHFSAQRKRILWKRGYNNGLFRGCAGGVMGD